MHNQISMGHARVLSKLTDPNKIEELARRIVKEDLSVRTLESLVYDNVDKPKDKEAKTSNHKYDYLLW